MGNPWESSNRWGKGGAYYGKWMEGGGLHPSDEFALGPSIGTMAIYDEFCLPLFGGEAEANVRLLKRAQFLKLKSLAESTEDLFEKCQIQSRQLSIISLEDQRVLSSGLLAESEKIGFELVAYVVYNFEEGKLVWKNEKNSTRNSIDRSYSYFSNYSIVNVVDSVSGGVIQNYYIDGDRRNRVIGVIHTHPSGGNSKFSGFDYQSSDHLKIPIFAIQEGKVLFKVPGEFGQDGKHNLVDGPFDFARFSLSNYSNEKIYKI